MNNYNQDLIKADAEETKAVKEQVAAAIANLNLSDEKDKAWSNIFDGASNELPTGKPFRFVGVKDVVNESNPSMNHLVMVTDSGEECSLSSLTRLCLTGKAAESPLFKASKKSSSLSKYAVLRDAKSVSPELTRWFNKNRVNRKGQAEALILSKLEFVATPVETLTYFPSEEDRNTIPVEDVDAFNMEPADVRIAKCAPKDAYIVTLAK